MYVISLSHNAWDSQFIMLAKGSTVLGMEIELLVNQKAEVLEGPQFMKTDKVVWDCMMHRVSSSLAKMRIVKNK